METRYLKTFVEVVKIGSFSRAAEVLHITQSAVSQRIKFVEEQYGVPLIDRNGSVITATDAGRALLKKSQLILMLENEIDGMLDEFKTDSRLSVGCTPTFGTVYLSKILSRFYLVNSEKARVKSHVNSPDNVLKGILKNEYDLAVLEHWKEINVANIVCTPLPPDELTIVSAPLMGFPEGPTSLSELLKQRLIARRDGCSSRGLLANNLAQFGKDITDFKSIVVHDDLSMTIQTALAGLGLAFVSKCLVREHIEKGSLLEHTVEGFSCFRSRSIVFNRKHHGSKCFTSFIQCVEELMA